MYYNLHQKNIKETTVAYLKSNNDISELDIQEDSVSFKYTKEIELINVDLMSLDKTPYKMYGTNETTYNYYEFNGEGILTESYPLEEGLMLFHYDFILEQMKSYPEGIIYNVLLKYLKEEDKKELLNLAKEHGFTEEEDYRGDN